MKQGDTVYIITDAWNILPVRLVLLGVNTCCLQDLDAAAVGTYWRTENTVYETREAAMRAAVERLPVEIDNERRDIEMAKVRLHDMECMLTYYKKELKQ